MDVFHQYLLEFVFEQKICDFHTSAYFSAFRCSFQNIRILIMTNFMCALEYDKFTNKLEINQLFATTQLADYIQD